MPIYSDPMRDTERFRAMRDALRDAVSSPAPVRREVKSSDHRGDADAGAAEYPRRSGDLARLVRVVCWQRAKDFARQAW